MTRKRIGEILKEHGKVSEDQIAEALERQVMSDKALGHILFDMGLVTDDDVLDAWSEQLGTNIFDLTGYEAPADALQKLPRQLAEKHHIFPVCLTDDILTLAMCDPLGDEARREVEQTTGCQIEPVAGSALGIAQAIASNYGT